MTATRYTEAFRHPDALTRPIDLGQFGTFPGATALGVHFVDVLVHGWDLSQAVAEPYMPEDDLAQAALAIAQRYPTKPPVRSPNGAFATPLPTPAKSSQSEQLLAQLGRHY